MKLVVALRAVCAQGFITYMLASIELLEGCDIRVELSLTPVLSSRVLSVGGVEARSR